MERSVFLSTLKPLALRAHWSPADFYSRIIYSPFFRKAARFLGMLERDHKQRKKIENRIYSVHSQQVAKYIWQITERPCFIYSCQCLKERTMMSSPAEGCRDAARRWHCSLTSSLSSQPWLTVCTEDIIFSPRDMFTLCILSHKQKNELFFNAILAMKILLNL